MVIVASIGASTFVVFAMPDHITAKSRNVIGGHMVGLVLGSLFALIPANSMLTSTIVYALAVGCSILVMVIIDTEHPPASGTALGVTMVGFSVAVAIAIVASVLVLSIVHHFFRRYLRDLT
jgi:CBS-domain-containing membrane protein